MTVNTTNVTSGPYTGNGVTDTFDYDFPIEDKSELLVYQTDTDGNITTLVVDTDYTVTGAGVVSGGSITLTAGALANGHTVFIVSNRQDTQDIDFESQGGFYPDVHEKGLDKLTIILQQLKDAQDRRSLLFPNHLSRTKAQNALPTPGETGQTLAWDSTGKLVNATLADAEAATNLADSGGAALIGTSDGDTLQEFINRITLRRFNVSYYGAVGDGVTDDTAAVQAAIDAAYDAGGGSVVLTGVHVVSEEIDWPEKVNIIGSGWKLDGTDFFTPYGTGLILKSNAALGSSKGVIRAKMRGSGFASHMGLLTHCFINGYGDTNGGTGGGGTKGIIIDGCKAVHLYRNLINRCSGEAIAAVSTSGTPNTAKIFGNHLTQNYDHGIYLVGGEQMVQNNYVGNNRGAGVYSAAGSLLLTGNIIADSDGNGVYLIDTTGANISSNTIQDNRKNGVVVDSSGASDAEHIAITGNNIFDNGIDSSFTNDQRCGVRINTGTLTTGVISGNTIGNRRDPGDPEHAGAPTQQYGVYFNSTSTRVEWGGNVVSGNVIEDVRRATTKNLGISIGSSDGDENRLSTYLEGTYTPELQFGGSSSGITYSIRDGKYTRIGDMVVLRLNILLSSKGTSTGDATITLPITPAATAASVAIRVNSMGTGVTSPQGLISTGSNQINLGRLSSGNNVNLTDSDFTNASAVVVTVTYWV